MCSDFGGLDMRGVCGVALFLGGGAGWVAPGSRLPASDPGAEMDPWINKRGAHTTTTTTDHPASASATYTPPIAAAVSGRPERSNATTSAWGAGAGGGGGVAGGVVALREVGGCLVWIWRARVEGRAGAGAALGWGPCRVVWGV
ncbi:hypothetical protein PMIN01_05864 [Paraphaeosphaeria minitans]|uniref:Uncharacterized protein n=1 Tax=Paraphaeosphaeria minitans TaxID=565426 RepID=A0A9P6GKS1_9PLEO|nr:hypothetical protein PMIN01_05864 [Paraphaeosphaeria minitans]